MDQHQENKEAHKEKRNIWPYVLIFILIVITTIWLAILCFYLFAFDTITDIENFLCGDVDVVNNICKLRNLDANNAGDFLAGVFAPLAFLMLTIAVLLQYGEFRNQRLNNEKQNDILNEDLELRKADAHSKSRTELVNNFFRHIDNLLVAFFTQELKNGEIDRLRISMIENYPPNLRHDEKYDEYSNYVRKALYELTQTLENLNKKYPVHQDIGGVRAMILEEIGDFRKKNEKFQKASDLEYMKTIRVNIMNREIYKFFTDHVDLEESN